MGSQQTDTRALTEQEIFFPPNRTVPDSRTIATRLILFARLLFF
jgi:hypothetical protein